MVIYIGKALLQYHDAISPPLLALALLGIMTQARLALFWVASPMVAKASTVVTKVSFLNI
jgi:hypothetical protein